MSALTTAMVLPIIIDLFAMLILVGALYYPRHRRADLVGAKSNDRQDTEEAKS